MVRHRLAHLSRDAVGSPIIDSWGRVFFVLLAIFPAITALVSAYGLFFSPSTIINNLSLLNEVIPDNVLNIVHEQASRIASNNGSALSIGIVVGILVSLWSAMSGVKAMIDALNIIYEQKETRSFIKLNLVALAFTLAGFAAFLLAIASIIVLPLILLPIGLGSLTENAHPGRPLAGAAYRLVDRPRSPLPVRPGSPRGALAVGDCRQHIRCGDVDHRVVPVLWYLASFANYNATYGSLGAAVGEMIWLWISNTVMLLAPSLTLKLSIRPREISPSAQRSH